jgi:hypothetical protein
MISVPEAGLLPSERRPMRRDDGREAVGIERERPGQMNAHHFPVPGGGVLAGRSQRAAAIRSGWLGNGGDAGQRLDAADAEAFQVRQLETAQACNIAQSVGTGRVAEGRGIRHGANSDTI